MAAIIFDFDGTIADSRDFVIDYISRQTNKNPLSLRERHALRGLGIFSVVKKLNYPWWRMPGLIIRGRSEMSGSIKRLKPIEDIVSVIKKVHQEGHQVFIVSSNSLNNIRSFLNRYKIRKDILAIYGGIELFGKGSVIKQLMKEYNLDPEQTICVGDEVRDLEAAQSNGLRTIAVSWGFTGAEHLQAKKPTWLVSSPKELIKVLEQV